MMKVQTDNLINLSINPWYFCNFRCNFCYLTEEQLSSRKLLDLEVLDKRLKEIVQSGYKLGHADIYGGEVLLLPKGYLSDLKKVLHNNSIKEIEIITNLSAYNKEIIEDQDYGISVSFDFDQREKHEEVFNNLLKINRPFTILLLATPDVIKSDIDYWLTKLSLLSNLYCLEIKPYSINQANHAKIKDSDFEEFVKRVIESPVDRHYEILNENMLISALNGLRNSFSNDHVYITPNGNFGVLEFDLNDREYFLELGSFKDYIDWTVVELSRVSANEFCSSCEYFGRCLSEHLREVKSLDNSCNGFYHLIKWAEKKYD